MRLTTPTQTATHTDTHTNTYRQSLLAVVVVVAAAGSVNILYAQHAMTMTTRRAGGNGTASVDWTGRGSGAETEGDVGGVAAAAVANEWSSRPACSE